MLFTFFSFEAKGQFLQNSTTISTPPNLSFAVGVPHTGWKFQISPQKDAPFWGGMSIKDEVPNGTSFRIANYGQANGIGVISCLKNESEAGTLVINPEGGAVGIGTAFKHFSNQEYKL